MRTKPKFGGSLNRSKCEITGLNAGEKFSVFFIPGLNEESTVRIIFLQATPWPQKVIVHEAVSVSHLIILNLMEDKDVLVVTGEIPRGGRQDRTIRVDVVMPAQSQIPFPTSCVEASRWHRRGPESDASFSSSTHYLATKNLKLAAKIHFNQGAVSREVSQAQAKLPRSRGTRVQATQSPPSLESTLNHRQIVRKRQNFIQHLQSLVGQHPDAVGFEFTINIQRNSAEVYATHNLFAASRPKLLKMNLVKASAVRRAMTSEPVATERHVRTMLKQAENGLPRLEKIMDRATIRVRRTNKTILSNTEHNVLSGVFLHRHCIFERIQTTSPTYSLAE